MATLHLLEKEELKQIADELGSWVGYMQQPLPRDSFGVAQSIEVCTISYSDLRNSEKSAQACLQTNGIWHIQVWTRDSPDYYARVSHGQDGKGWQVNSLYGPGTARKIDAALRQVDKQFEDAYNIRLVEIPAYYITGLTLEKGEELLVYIISTPPGLPVKPGTAYPFEDLRRILHEVAPVRGVNIKD
ncbi:MAG: hypothetical protein J0H74_15925 [Chitinophagaceae bacterium]|nr:hypothetical protein [Chitinophagaceae bacterium]